MSGETSGGGEGEAKGSQGTRHTSPLKPSEVPFCGFCQLLDAIQNSAKEKKKLHLQNFHDKYLEKNSDDYFSFYRLLLPSHDKERGYYNLKESALAQALIDAVGLEKGVQSDAKRLEYWREGNDSKGDLVETAYDCVLVQNCSRSYKSAKDGSSLTVGQLNCELDALANAENKKDKAKVLRKLILALSPEEMKWVLKIVLRHRMRFGLGEHCILASIHPKAQELYNFTMNLRKVCEQLSDPDCLLQMQEVSVGNVVRPHLAKKVYSVKEAFSKMKGQDFVVETKFDGERVQVHKCLDGKVSYYSRTGLDHASWYGALDQMIRSLIKPAECVLDGEIIIWHKKIKQFLPFGTLRTVFKAISEGKSGDHVIQKSDGHDGLERYLEEENLFLRDCEPTYVAFDVLYTEYQGEMQSVIKIPLKERQKLLEDSISGVVGDAIKLEKNSGVSARLIRLLPGQCEFSRYGTDEESLQKQFDKSILQLEEGIVIKSLSSQWIAANRGSEWLKLKPDYVTDIEVDALIIGAKYGTGRRGGRLSQYILGIPRGKGHSNHLLSFCKVGNGLTESEQDEIHNKLLGNTVSPSQCPPMYRISDSGESPHVWVADPEKSIVLEVTGDVRTIPTNEFATGKSLRFPRVKRIRYDKGLYDLTTLEEIHEQKPEDVVKRQRKKGPSTSRAGARTLSVPKEFLPSGQEKLPAEVKSSLFSPLLFYLLNFGSGKFGKKEMEEAVKMHGGKVTLNLPKGYESNTCGLKCIAEKKDWRAEMLSKNVDVISNRWIWDSIDSNQLLDPLKYFL